MQRVKEIKLWRARRHETPTERRRRVAKARRGVAYQRRSGDTYRVHVSDAGRNTWATFLAQQTARPGWSVARLARESGIHRSTIFRWLKGDGGITMQSIRAIASALGVDMQTALLAAGNSVTAPPPPDPREDPIIQAILADPRWTEEQRTELVKAQIERMEQDLARRRAEYEMLRQYRSRDAD